MLCRKVVSTVVPGRQMPCEIPWWQTPKLKQLNSLVAADKAELKGQGTDVITSLMPTSCWMERTRYIESQVIRQ